MSAGEPSPVSGASRWISREFSELLSEADKWRDHPDADKPSFDVLIVGSGYGGAVAAATLAGCRDANGRPITVCVLERGREYLPGAFPSRMADLATQVRGSFAGRVRGGEGLFDIRASGDVSVVLGNGLGGGSLINAGVMEIPRDEVLDRFWPEARRGGPDHAYYTRAKEMLGAMVAGGDNVMSPLPQKAQVLKQMGATAFRPAAITVALTDKESQGGVNLSACKQCGDCATGCNYGAKESLDTNLLVTAFRRGAEIYCGATVLRVQRPLNREGNQNKEFWSMLVTHTDEKLRLRECRPRWITARKVILAAGALGSTEILLRSQRAPGGPLFSQQLGRRFSGNGDMLSFGYDHAPANAIANEDDLPGGRQVGPTITGALDAEINLGSRCAPRLQNIVIEEMAVPGPLRRFAEEMITTADTLHALGEKDGRPHHLGHPVNDPYAVNPAKLARTSIFAAMGDDGAGGALNLAVADDGLSDGHISVNWPEVKNLPLFDAQIEHIQKLAKAADLSGRTIPNPLWRFVPQSMEFLIGDQRGPLLTVHPLGGCPIGVSAEGGVVNEFGRVFDAPAPDVTARSKRAATPAKLHEGLYVLDGAIVPNALSTNPALTIAALALRAAERLREGARWARPELAAKPQDRPVFRAEAEIEAEISRWRAKPAAMAEFTERLSGPVQLEDAGNRLQDCWLEITLTYDPLPLKNLFTPDARGRLSDARLQVSGAQAVDGQPKGRLRIFLRSEWERLQQQHRTGHDRERAEDAAARSYELTGSLTILQREASTACLRIFRGLRAFVCNRALRDIYQAWKGREPGKKQAWRQRACEAWRLASHAGEIRLFQYELKIECEVSPAARGVKRFESPDWSAGPAIRGHKRITYARPSNPWRQLMELSLVWFAGPIGPAVLTLDPQYLAARGRPLFRIESQRDHQEALLDALSLGALFLRMLLSIHLWNARKPDKPHQREIQRLPGPLPHLPAPEYHTIDVDRVDAAPVFAKLTRYRSKKTDSTLAPVLMIHGYSASGTTFAHPALKPSLAQYLAERGRDVWVADLRSSCGMPTATKPWTFERIALTDIPALVDHVYWNAGGGKKIDVVAHCMGAAMFSMAVLSADKDALDGEILSGRDRGFEDRFRARRRALPRRINRAVLSQIGPVMVLSQQNIFRAYVMSFVEQVLGPLSYRFRPEEGEGLASELLDRLLSTLPYADNELLQENPTRPCARTEYAASRHRMDALYGGAFKLGNLSADVLDHIDDFFGPMSLDTASQVIHFAELRSIANRAGRNRFVTREALEKFWTFPTLSIHGELNALADVATVHHLNNVMKATDDKFDFQILPGRGHQDCLIGENLVPTFRELQRFLDGGRPRRSSPPVSSEPPFRAEAPSLGPALMYDPDGNVCVSLGASPRLGIPLAYCMLPVMQQPQCGWTIQESVLTLSPGSIFWNETKWGLSQDQATDWHSEPLPGWSKSDAVRQVAVLLIYPQPGCMGEPFLTYFQDFFAGSARQSGTATRHSEVEQEMLAAARRTLSEMAHDALGLVTLPRKQEKSLRLALGSCQYPPGMLDEVPAYRSWERLNVRLDDPARRPDLLILTGDQVYVDATAGLFDPTQGDDRYRKPHEKWLRNTQVRNVLRRVPALTMLDDHEMDDNWEPIAPAPDRAAFDRNELFRQDGIASFVNYQRARWGEKSPLWFKTPINGIGVFMLDTRSERGGRAARSSTSAAMLSPKQSGELRDWLDQQDKDVPKLIVSPSVLLPRRRQAAGASLRSDAWDGYPDTLYELLGYIAENNLHKVVFLSGDEHLGLYATAKIKLVGSDAAVTIHSIHTAGLYTPYRFANAQPSDFIRKETLRFQTGGKDYECDVDSAVFEGCGFTYVSLARDPQGWNLKCEFDDGTGRDGRIRSVLL